jgi:hypothetical protein
VGGRERLYRARVRSAAGVCGVEARVCARIGVAPSEKQGSTFALTMGRLYETVQVKFRRLGYQLGVESAPVDL